MTIDNMLRNRGVELPNEWEARTIEKALVKLLDALDYDEKHSEFGQSLIVREAYEEARALLLKQETRPVCTCHGLTADKCPSWNAR